MILNNINYKMPIFRDCTLGEILGVGLVVLVTEATALSFITKMISGYAVAGVVLTFLSFFHITKFLLGQLQKLKYGKPYGYYTHLLIKKLMQYGMIKNIYLTRVGLWSTRRSK